MRDFFMLTLSETNQKNEEVGTVFIMLHQIVGIRKMEKMSEVITVNGKIFVKETFEDMLKKCSTYGLLKVM